MQTSSTGCEETINGDIWQEHDETGPDLLILLLTMNGAQIAGKSRDDGLCTFYAVEVAHWLRLQIDKLAAQSLAEPIRLLLVDQGIKFTDEHIPKDDFVSIKSQFQFGQLPCFYDGDQQIVQSGAILRHLARKFNLNGENNAETTYVDMFYEGIRDLHSKYTRMIYEAYETQKDPFIKIYCHKNWRNLKNCWLLETMEKISFSEARLRPFEELDVQQILDPHCLEKFPLLKAFHQRLGDKPKIKEYCAKRNASKMPVNGNGKQ
ncbi:GST class-pi [Dirofilaria immitis]|nr:GST class-pi [Dirofilaria immitis]